jgi:hypothetical protein
MPEKKDLRTFSQVYAAMWTDEVMNHKNSMITIANGKILDKVEYGKRKFAAIRTMTKEEIYHSFKNDEKFGSKLSGKGKEAMIRTLKQYTGFF